MGLLTNLGVGPAMGITAENVADEYDVTREQMDALFPPLPAESCGGCGRWQIQG